MCNIHVSSSFPIFELDQPGSPQRILHLCKIIGSHSWGSTIQNIETRKVYDLSGRREHEPWPLRTIRVRNSERYLQSVMADSLSGGIKRSNVDFACRGIIQAETNVVAVRCPCRSYTSNLGLRNRPRDWSSRTGAGLSRTHLGYQPLRTVGERLIGRFPGVSGLRTYPVNSHPFRPWRSERPGSSSGRGTPENRPRRTADKAYSPSGKCCGCTRSLRAADHLRHPPDRREKQSRPVRTDTQAPRGATAP